MRRVRQRDTQPEQAVRGLLRSLGWRYRVCPSRLPGRPDIANQRHQWAIFVHGCFWHGHAGCRLAKIPARNATFWRSKFDANRQRDARKTAALGDRGFKVLVVWQCELRDEGLLARRLKTFLREASDA